MVRVKVSDGHSSFIMLSESDSGLSLETVKSVIPACTNLIDQSNPQEPLYLRYLYFVLLFTNYFLVFVIVKSTIQRAGTLKLSTWLI